MRHVFYPLEKAFRLKRTRHTHRGLRSVDQHKNFIRKVSRGVSFYDVGKGINGVTCENAKPILIIIHYRIGNNFAEHSAKGWRDDDDLNWFQKWDFALLNVHCRLRQTAKGKSFFCSRCRRYHCIVRAFSKSSSSF